VSRRIDFWGFLTWLLLTAGAVIVWLVLSALLDMSRDEMLVSGAVMGALLLLLMLAGIGWK
jgi:hypothetical protein